MIRNCSAINSGWGLPWICFVTRGPMYTLARGGLHFRKKEKFAPGDGVICRYDPTQDGSY